MRSLTPKFLLLPLLLAVTAAPLPLGNASALRCIGCPIDGPPFSDRAGRVADHGATPALRAAP